jgi:hypothetical protein
MTFSLIFYLCYTVFGSVLPSTPPQLKDTIDYTQFPLNIRDYFSLYKIQQLNGQVYTQLSGHRSLQFHKRDDTIVIVKGVKANPGDTLIDVSWYRYAKDFSSESRIHGLGKLRLNRKSNVLLITRYVFNKKIDNYEPRTGLFDIVKLTHREIILRDLSTPALNRYYYFNRINDPK